MAVIAQQREDPQESNNIFKSNRDQALIMFQEMEEEYKALGALPPSLVVRTIADNSHFDKLAEQETGEPGKGVIEVDGSQLNYVIEGEGIPCLVLGSSIYYPRTFSNNLRQHLKMYFVDMKWFAKGYGPEDLNKVNIESIVQDVEQIRTALGLEMPLILFEESGHTPQLEESQKFDKELINWINQKIK